MPRVTGSYNLYDLAEMEDVNVFDFGEQALADALQADIEAHNRLLTEMASSLMLVTQERILTYGMNYEAGYMKRAEEYTRFTTRRIEESGGTFNLPLERYQDGLGWTKDYLENATVAQVANQVQSIQNDDINTMYRDARNALFQPDNYTVRDKHVDYADMNVKRLVNGDGMPIPNQQGNSFDADTHTHYLANNGWDNASIDAAFEHVREHGHRSNLALYINEDNRNAIAGLSKFRALQRSLVVYGADQTVARDAEDLEADSDNRYIGTWDDAYRVYTKPWIPANYAFVHSMSGPRVLAMRVPDRANRRGLRLIANVDAHPLRADGYEHLFGIGVNERTNGAVLYLGGATYAAPSV